MPFFLLHGLWVQESGLHLWIEQVEGHRIVLPNAVPADTFPPEVEEIIRGANFRHRLKATLRTPKGRQVSLTIPTLSMGPHRTIDFLATLAAADREDSRWETIAPDLRWIIHAYSGLLRCVRSGKVVPTLVFADEQWWPQFHLAPGLVEGTWLNSMVEAAPGVLKVNNGTLAADLAGTLVNWIAHHVLRDLRTTPRVYPWHNFAAGLLRAEPLAQAGVPLLNRLRDWRESLQSAEYSLVLIIEEPDTTDLGEESVVVDDLLWPVRVRARMGNEIPAPIYLEAFDTTSRLKLSRQHRHLQLDYPVLNPAEHGQTKLNAAHVSRASAESALDPDEYGEWDVFLDSAQLVDFITNDVPRLQLDGITVMLPKSWARGVASTEALFKVSEPEDPAEGPSFSRMGLDQLLEYRWQLSVGDTQLDDSQMHELVESKSGLIRLRDQWVVADTRTVNHVRNYMEEFAKKSARKRREALWALQGELQHLGPNDPQRAILEGQIADLQEAIATEAGSESGELTVAEIRALMLAQKPEEELPVQATGWAAALAGLVEDPAALPAPRVPIPESVQAHLRDYQQEGVSWLYNMSQHNLGAVLADDMGLGKTLQLLTMLATEKDRGQLSGPTLVVAPTSVVGNWAKEAARFVPSLKVQVHHGPGRARREEIVQQARDNDVIITSYGMVRSDVAFLRDVQWDHVVLDEAQFVKNSSTRTARAVRALPSRQRIALTGTPIENSLSELRSILDFVNPGMLGGKSQFQHRFARPIEREHNQVAITQLRNLTQPFILRRLKDDPEIISDLPDKHEEILVVDLTREQAALYQSYVQQLQEVMRTKEGMQLKGLVLKSITKIKQICNHPAHFLQDGTGVLDHGRHRSGKVAKLMEILDAAHTRGERTLVFTQYRRFGELLQPYLSEHYMQPIPFLHGSLTPTERDRMVARFQSADGAPVMLLSLKAGGTGLNLTAANVVVHMDRWWNPAVENQATDRAFRIGQDKDVHVYKMIARGTMEESIQDILDGKTILAGAVVGAGEGWITQLSPEQLAQLMAYKDGDL